MKTEKRFKKRKIVLVVFLVLVVLVSTAVGYIQFALPNVGEPPQLKVTITPELVSKGSYLANHVMVCMDCHSTRNWGEFAGPLEAGTLGKGGEVFGPEIGFPGTFYSRNITPDGIGSWTDGEIFRTITTGVNKFGKVIFPVMPYHNYGHLDSADIVSVIAYLRTLPAISNTPETSKPDFPMGLIMHTIPVRAQLTKRPDTANTLAYGKYLITAASCGDCHTQVDDKGQFLPGVAFAGGRSFKLPSGTVSSANLTPDKETGTGYLTETEFVAKFAKYRGELNAHHAVGATDFNTIMPWIMYAGMKDSDLKAIYRYIQSLKPIKNTVVKFVPKGV